jgi:S-phase kinase-associated protein 1
MAEESNPPKMITLVSSDDVNVLVPRNAANLSALITDALALDDEEEEPDSYKPVEIKRVSSKTLELVVEFLVYFRDTPMLEIPDPLQSPIGATLEETVPQQWYRNYVEGLGLDTMYRVRSAAGFMGIEPLIMLTNVWLAFYLMDKTEAEMHEILCIPVMTPEQEAKARQDHPWLFEVLADHDDADDAAA